MAGPFGIVSTSLLNEYITTNNKKSIRETRNICLNAEVKNRTNTAPLEFISRSGNIGINEMR